MRAVEKMLAQVHKVLGKQVYVEAQLIDVQLSDNFEFGVDWTSLRSRLAAGFGSSPMQLGGSSGTLPNAATGYPCRAISIPAALIGSVAGPALGVSYQGSNYGIVINALRSLAISRSCPTPTCRYAMAPLRCCRWAPVRGTSLSPHRHELCRAVELPPPRPAYRPTRCSPASWWACCPWCVMMVASSCC